MAEHVTSRSVWSVGETVAEQVPVTGSEADSGAVRTAVVIDAPAIEP